MESSAEATERVLANAGKCPFPKEDSHGEASLIRAGDEAGVCGIRKNPLGIETKRITYGRPTWVTCPSEWGHSSFISRNFPSCIRFRLYGGKDDPKGLSLLLPFLIVSASIVINRHRAHGRAGAASYLERQAGEDELRVHHFLQIRQVLHVQHLTLPARLMRPVALVRKRL